MVLYQSHALLKLFEFSLNVLSCVYCVVVLFCVFRYKHICERVTYVFLFALLVILMANSFK